MVVGSIALFLTRGLNLAIDFTGGVNVAATFPTAANVDAVRAAMGRAGYPDPQVQELRLARARCPSACRPWGRSRTPRPSARS